MCAVCMLSHFSCVRLCAIRWTVDCQALCLWDTLDNNTGVGCNALFQGIFLTQGWNLYLLWLLRCRQIFLLLSSQRSPMHIKCCSLTFLNWINIAIIEGALSYYLRNLYYKALEDFCVCACMLSHFSCVQLFPTLWTVARQAPLSVGFSRQECWSGLGDLPDLEIKPASLTSPSLAGRFFTISPTWKAWGFLHGNKNNSFFFSFFHE